VLVALVTEIVDGAESSQAAAILLHRAAARGGREAPLVTLADGRNDGGVAVDRKLDGTGEGSGSERGGGSGDGGRH